MIKLNDFNYNGLFRSLLREGPQENFAIVIVKNSQEERKDEESGNHEVLEDKKYPKESLRNTSESSDSEPPNEPTTYKLSDSISIKRARKKCVYACRSAYRHVCRIFRWECSRKMRRYFREECYDECEIRF
ncbi:unnamed protein product [Leptosia nina]|uniref:Uncharacterized protein n=1 Tax=Leptosia nina TaxID=320188 RepID=A0AAV1JKQ7_9NEOP